MKIKNQTTMKITLKLEEHEALWLKGIMQNPLHGENPEEESRKDKKMRTLFWNALKSKV
jgi:hypothetical protein